MATEIERKFLLKNDDWKKEVTKSTSIKQGYLATDAERTVRVRVKGEKGFLTVKGKTEGVSRAEFEYEIPLEDALALLKLCHQPIIEKVRNIVKQGNHTWEIDAFEGENAGLTLAEIELSHEEEAFEKPDWLAEEVSSDYRYFNSYLVKNPFGGW